MHCNLVSHICQSLQFPCQQKQDGPGGINQIILKNIFKEGNLQVKDLCTALATMHLIIYFHQNYFL